MNRIVSFTSIHFRRNERNKHNSESMRDFLCTTHATCMTQRLFPAHLMISIYSGKNAEKKPTRSAIA